MGHKHVMFVCVAQTDKLPHLLLVPVDNSKRCSVMSFYAELAFALRVLSIKCWKGDCKKCDCKSICLIATILKSGQHCSVEYVCWCKGRDGAWKVG